MFATAFSTCIKGFGEWEISGNKPCEVLNTDTEQLKKDLKSKLNYDCPEGATCKTYTHGNINATRFRYHCVSIAKKVSGKKLQVVVRIPYDTPNNYQMLCAEVPSMPAGTEEYMPLKAPTCKKSGHSLIAKYFGGPGCPWK